MTSARILAKQLSHIPCDIGLSARSSSFSHAGSGRTHHAHTDILSWVNSIGFRICPGGQLETCRGGTRYLGFDGVSIVGDGVLLTVPGLYTVTGMVAMDFIVDTGATTAIVGV